MHILLLHGMGRTPLSMLGLSRDLSRAGHRTELLGYGAAFETFARIRSRVRRRVEHLAGSGQRYAVVGHSLGGLALRAALEGVHPQPAQFIMLGTPNRVPRLAE